MTVCYDDLFRQATGCERPYDCQRRLAESDSFPVLLDMPTSTGKTASVLGAWCYRRFFHPNEAIRHSTSRRLIYVLPMRVLCEQTHKEARRWVECVRQLADQAFEPNQARQLNVHLLMGGEEPADWALYPERNAILIGTQDMLLSRALNRGYAASRYRWPMEFGLLNNDCFWVMDEVQLMGSGLATTAQLKAFQSGGKQTLGWGCFNQCQFLWMSATLQPRWLETVDHSAPSEPPFALSPEEKTNSTTPLGKRLHAAKGFGRARNIWEKKPVALACEIVASHRTANEGESEPVMTLVVVNRVGRAVSLWEEICKVTRKEKFAAEPLLIHSRFRFPDRQRQMERLLSARSSEGRIVIATQVVEAGVDVSAKVLFTELAPWASLVQRFGRCNRKGEYENKGSTNGAKVYWIDVADKDSAPYESEDAALARQLLQDSDLTNVGPMVLEKFLGRQSTEIVARLFTQRCNHVVRRKDVLELFDTTPDLAGNDIDISRYIRDGDEHDVQVFWREIPKGGKPDETVRRPRREELCPVPAMKDFREFINVNNGRVWRWDFLDSEWVPAHSNQVFPGQMFLIACDAGGYSPDKGWHGMAEQNVPSIALSDGDTRPEGNDDDLDSELGVWQSIAEHTDDVCRTLEDILALLSDDLPLDVLRLAAQWHDRGKAHPAFRAKLREDLVKAGRAARILAQAGGYVGKAPRDCWRRNPRTQARWNEADGRRRHFRHELASALAVLQASGALIPETARNLAAYLVAAHHGKVRLSIRSLPDEFRPRNDKGRFARGIWDGDTLPETVIASGLCAPEVKLDLDPMELGRSSDGRLSWAERMLTLRDALELGPFRLAYLEALLRAADRRASMEAESRKENSDA